MKLHRLSLLPRSPWRTPWQADTLTGALCATAARVHGGAFLRQSLIEPMRAGSPPFVLSDGFPGGLLPLPLGVRLSESPLDADRKAIKRGRWLSRADFVCLRSMDDRAEVPWDRVRSDSDVYCSVATRHNTLARDSDVSLDEGGLFARLDVCLEAGQGEHAGLDLYFRAANEGAAELLLDLLHELSLTGFGADIATGRGQFDIAREPEPARDLDDPPTAANGVVCLSTFQPAPGDPNDGFWEAFPKFGKLGHGLGISEVRKHTLIMLRPGACFQADPALPFLGRALPMDDVLPAHSAGQLRGREIEIVHPAFGLAIPARFDVPVKGIQ